MIEIYSDAKELAQAAAEYFVAQGPETVALSGGSTPKLMFQVLAEQFRDEVAWSRIQFFWSDERHVPPDDPESNYRMANEALLSHVSVSADNVHRVRGENPDADAAAREYEQTIIDVTRQSLPRLDLIFLGLGTAIPLRSFPVRKCCTKRSVSSPRPTSRSSRAIASR
jgi:6-phosphogluconolactonase